jgi:hypothetical protein
MKSVKSKINKIIQVNTTATASTGQVLRLLVRVTLKVKFDKSQGKSRMMRKLDAKTCMRDGSKNKKANRMRKIRIRM